MRSNIVKIFLSLSLLLSSSALWAAKTPEELRAELADKRVDDVIFKMWVAEDVTVEDLEEAIKGHFKGSPPQKIKKRIGDYRKYLAKQDKAHIREAQPTRKSEHFYGHPSKAKDASAEEQAQYARIFELLAKALVDRKISQTNYDQARVLLIALHIWHSNLVVITKESNDRARAHGEPHSPTYEKLFRAAIHAVDRSYTLGAPSLHAERNYLGLEFQDKPAFLLGTGAHVSAEDAAVHPSFLQGLEFAIEYGLLEEFLTALTGVSGCLEAHFGAGSDWVMKKRSELDRRRPAFTPKRSGAASAAGAGAAAAEPGAGARPEDAVEAPPSSTRRNTAETREMLRRTAVGLPGTPERAVPDRDADIRRVDAILRAEGGFYKGPDDSRDEVADDEADPLAFAREVFTAAQGAARKARPSKEEIIFAAKILRQTSGYRMEDPLNPTPHTTPGNTPHGTPQRRPAPSRYGMPRSPERHEVIAPPPGFLPKGAVEDITQLSADERRVLAEFLISGISDAPASPGARLELPSTPRGQISGSAAAAATAAGADVTDDGDDDGISMPAFAAQHGLYNPVGDGLCFLHALAFALVGADDHGVIAQLQALVVDQILLNPAHFADFHLGNPAAQLAAVNAHLDGIFNGEWADDPVIQGLVIAANLHLVIHHYDVHGHFIATYNFGNPLAPNHAVLVNIGNLHFMAQPPPALPVGVPHLILGPAALAVGFATPQVSPIASGAPGGFPLPASPVAAASAGGEGASAGAPHDHADGGLGSPGVSPIAPEAPGEFPAAPAAPVVHAALVALGIALSLNPQVSASLHPGRRSP